MVALELEINVPVPFECEFGQNVFARPGEYEVRTRKRIFSAGRGQKVVLRLPRTAKCCAKSVTEEKELNKKYYSNIYDNGKRERID